MTGPASDDWAERPAPRIGLRVAGLDELFDPHAPGPLAERAIIEPGIADYLLARIDRKSTRLNSSHT